MSVININGELQKSKKAVLTCNNRGLKYGDAVFETIRVCNGKPLFFNSHKQRLLEAMQSLKMNTPDWFKQFYLFFEIEKTLEANKIRKGGRVRLTVVRKDGGLYTPLSNDVDVIVEAQNLDNNEYRINDIGLRIGLYNDIKKPINQLGKYKTANSQIYVLAALHKKQQELDDCLILNTDNNICEAISSNVFLVRGKTVFTPSQEEGAVKGIMQKHIFEMLKKHDYELEETEIKPAMIEDCQEIFLTNTIQGIRWVNKLEKNIFKKSLSEVLMQDLNLYVKKISST